MSSAAGRLPRHSGIAITAELYLTLYKETDAAASASRGTTARHDPLARALVAAAGLLAQAGALAIAYGCTVGSMIEPLDGLTALIARTTGIPERPTYSRCAMILPLRL
jgi:hypothetical protein